MRPRIPLAVAVVGALLVGGATTGATHASWTDGVTQSGDAISTGRLSYTASTPNGVTVDKSATSSADTLISLDDTSLGKNIAQRISATIGSTPTGVSATVGTTCGSATNFVDTTPASATQTLCVRVTSSTTAVSGNVTVNLSSAQKPTAGWTTPQISRSVAVTVSAPTTTAPTGIECGDLNADGRLISWSSVGEGVTYRVYDVTASPAVRIIDNLASTSVRLRRTTALSGQPHTAPNNAIYAVRAVSGTTESANGSPRINIQWSADKCNPVSP